MLRTLAIAAVVLVSVPHGAAAIPLISEVFYDAIGSDNGQSFVELHGAPGTPLAGLFLEGINGANGAAGPTVALEGVIAATGLFVVADDQGDGTTQVENADWIVNFDFQNGPDSVVLRSVATVLDAIGYGVFGAGEFFAGEGQAAPDPLAGQSLARRFANVDTDDNAVDFVALFAPTPGSAPLSEVPEPGTAALFAGGLVALGRLRRRGLSRR